VIESDAIVLVARNEFYRVLKNPLAIIVGVIILFLAYINGIGGASQLSLSDFMIGYSQINADTVLIICIMAAFLGVVSMSEERWINSFNVLLTKPIYRRDIVLGKWFGLVGFMILFVTLLMLFTTSMLIIGFNGAPSYPVLFCKLAFYIIVLVMESSLVISLTMLLGTVFKNILGAMSLVMVYLYADWFQGISNYIGAFSVFTPNMLYYKIVSPSGNVPFELLDTTIPFDKWLGDATPYLIIILAEIVILIFANCLVFNRQD